MRWMQQTICAWIYKSRIKRVALYYLFIIVASKKYMAFLPIIIALGVPFLCIRITPRIFLETILSITLMYFNHNATRISKFDTWRTGETFRWMPFKQFGRCFASLFSSFLSIHFFSSYMFWIRSFNFCHSLTPFLNFPLFVSVARFHVWCIGLVSFHRSQIPKNRITTV